MEVNAVGSLQEDLKLGLELRHAMRGGVNCDAISTAQPMEIADIVEGDSGEDVAVDDRYSTRLALD